MQPCSREMQMAFQELQNGSHHPINDDFLDQMLSSLPSWSDLDGTNGGDGGRGGTHFVPFDESTLLASRLRQHQINEDGGSDRGRGAAGKAVGFHQLSQQQQMILSSMGRSSTAGGSGGGEPGLLPLPLTLGSNGSGLVDRSRDDEDTTSFKSSNSTGDGEGLFNGFARSLQQQQQHFINVQGGSQNFGASSAPTGNTGGGGAAATVAAPRQRVRARRGQATDPHSIAERLRRERIAERMKALQELVPNANKTDKASMLDEIIDYVKFLQLQVKVLSMSRLGGAAAVAPLVADISSEAGRGAGAPSANDSLTVTEQQVAKLMEEDMGSAMQYLQGKGLCLMPISLASAISTATCHPRAGSSSAAAGGGLMSASFLSNPNGDGPSSPSLSVLTVQSAVAGGTDSVKEAASVSKP